MTSSSSDFLFARRALTCVSVFLIASVPAMAIADSNAKSGKGKAVSTQPRTVPIKKVFGFYDRYLALPPEGRDGFSMVYSLRSDQNAPRPQAHYVLGNTRTPIQLSPTGTVLNMPNAAMYSNGMVEIPAGSPPTSVTMNLQPIVPLSRSIAVAAVANPLNDYAAAIRRAGPLALMAPRLTGIRFSGGSGGAVVFGDGRRVAMASAPDGGVVFRPGLPANRGAASLSFATPPNSVEFAQ